MKPWDIRSDRYVAGRMEHCLRIIHTPTGVTVLQKKEPPYMDAAAMYGKLEVLVESMLNKPLDK